MLLARANRTTVLKNKIKQNAVIAVSSANGTVASPQARMGTGMNVVVAKKTVIVWLKKNWVIHTILMLGRGRGMKKTTTDVRTKKKATE